MPSQLSLRRLQLVVVALYLTGAGWFFVLAPWSNYWADNVVSGCPLWCAALVAHPAVRGALSGFGVLHFAMAFSWLNAGTG